MMRFARAFTTSMVVALVLLGAVVRACSDNPDAGGSGMHRR